VIVFDLKCPKNHVFEGWFGSSDDYEDQRARGLLACPMCGDVSVAKAVMAPAVAAKGNQRVENLPVPNSASAPPTGRSKTVPVSSGMDLEKAQLLMSALAEAQSAALKNSEWVGRGFADAARAMHYGEQEYKPIHGEVAADEAKGLIEEGIEVAPLIFPIIPPKAQN
jgi:hypothetical protein